MPDAGALPLLEVDVTEKTYVRGRERLNVVGALRFALKRGDVTCLLGPSGCGKTTALRIIMGLDNDYIGSIRPAPQSLRLGVVFQDPRLLPWRTVEQNVSLAAPLLPKAALDALLAELGLDMWRTKRPNQLSGGMARRVALARALAVEPDLLILDEAFVSLDERNAEILRAVVFAAVEKRGTTVLMVTHNIREAMQVADVILLLGPRPTHVVEALELGTARPVRTAAWLDAERKKLIGVNQTFMALDA